MPDSPRIEELKRRIRLDPASIAFAALAEEYRRTGRYEEAIEICRRGLQRHASYISAHVTLGRALIETGRCDEARQELQYVLSVAPENLAAIRGLAEIHHRQRQFCDQPDVIASEMADVLARPAPPPAEPVKVRSWEPPATAAEAPAPPATVIERSIELPPAAAATPQPSPAMPETPEAEPPQASAGAPIARPAERSKDDQALRDLEAFLQAILRAREAAARTRAM